MHFLKRGETFFAECTFILIHKNGLNLPGSLQKLHIKGVFLLFMNVFPNTSAKGWLLRNMVIKGQGSTYIDTFIDQPKFKGSIR